VPGADAPGTSRDAVLKKLQWDRRILQLDRA
jgi:hypothetical protein